MYNTRKTIHTTHLCSWVSWCLPFAWILVLLTLLFAFGRNAGTEHRFHCPVRTMMVIIEPPLAPRRLCLCPSPRLSSGVVLVVFPTCCTTTASPGFRLACDSTEMSRSFTVTIDCTSCQKVCLSNLGELFPTYFIKQLLCALLPCCTSLRHGP